MGTALALAFGVNDASAAKRQVGTCTTNSLQYSTVQAAVSASVSGDTVQICPGSYPEEVTVSKAISLTNVPSMADPTIAIPAGGAVQNTQTLGGSPTAAQIVVIGAKANVRNLIVDGSNNNINTCGLQLIGIYYQNSGGAMTGNTVQNQLLPPGYQGCQSGLGIYVQNETVGTPAVSIVGNSVNNFDKNGITANEAASSAIIKNNIVTGVGPTDQIAQNGIQLGFGATGQVIENQVSNLVYTGTAGAADGGILLYDIDASATTAPKILGNTVSNAQVGIWLDAVNGTSSSMVPVQNNNVSGAVYAGIGLYSDPGTGLNDDFIKVVNNVVDGTNPYDDIDVCSDNNIIQKNTVSNSAEGGIHLDGLCQETDTSTTGVNNLVAVNEIDTNCVGILSGPAVGLNTIKRNTFSGNTNNYQYGSDSASCTAHHHGVSKRLTPFASVQPFRQ